MIPAESFWTYSLRAAPQGESVTRILAAAVNAVEPGEAVRRFVRRDRDTLTISDRTYDLSAFRRVMLLGIGKAAVAMSEALAGILGDYLVDNLVITKHIPHIRIHHSSFWLLAIPSRTNAACWRGKRWSSSYPPSARLTCSSA